MIYSRTVSHFVPIALMVLLGLGSPLSASGQSLFTDPVAHQEGDVLTIVLAEQTSAQRESSYEGNSSSSMSGGGGVSAPSIESRFSGDAQINTETNNSNESVQSGVLNGTVTARVTQVNQAGNLLVEGERRLTINGVTHVMRVSGLVRPSDVRHDNTILSHQIANANIRYNQAGLRHSGFFSKGFFLKVGSVAAIGLSIFLGLK